AETVNLHASSTALSVNPSSITVGGTVTLSATVTGTSPTGSVTFNEGATVLGTARLSAGQASLNATVMSAGSHSLTATYSGDASNAGSTSSSTSMSVAPATTTTALSATPNPVLPDSPATLTAVVTGVAPTGSVTFMDGATTLGTAALASGQASLTASFISAASH